MSTAGRNALYAVAKKTLSAPAEQGRDEQLRDREAAQRGQRPGCSPNAASETRSAAIMTRRRASRSTHAPCGRPMTSQGSHAAAVSALIANTLACKVRATSR